MDEEKNTKNNKKDSKHPVNIFIKLWIFITSIFINKPQKSTPQPKDCIEDTRNDTFYIRITRKNNQWEPLIWVNIGMLLAFIAFGLNQCIETKRSVRQDLRAYLSVHITNEGGISVGGLSNIYNISIENTGKTTAYNIMWAGTDKIREQEIFQEDMDSIVKLTPHINKGFINSGQSLPFDQVIISKLNDANIVGIKEASTPILIVFGDITYTDIFDIEHFTRYCFYYKEGAGFNINTKYNDADHHN